MKLCHLALVPALLLTGCATNLSAVRDFADETKKISVAFDPVLDRAVDQCQQKTLQKSIYTTSRPLKDFDPSKAVADAKDACQPIVDANTSAKQISQALADYATQLSELAADGVATSVNDNYDALAAKIGAFEGVPQDKVGAATALLKFITRNVLAKAQRDAIVEMLSHEEGVDTLADALVVYTDRVYGGYVTERLRDQEDFLMALGAETATPISSRLRMMEVRQQTVTLQQQKQTVANFRRAVAQMKASLHDLRQNVDKLSDKERLIQVKKLAKEVKALYAQLAKAF